MRPSSVCVPVRLRCSGVTVTTVGFLVLGEFTFDSHRNNRQKALATDRIYDAIWRRTGTTSTSKTCWCRSDLGKFCEHGIRQLQPRCRNIFLQVGN